MLQRQKPVWWVWRLFQGYKKKLILHKLPDNLIELFLDGTLTTTALITYYGLKILLYFGVSKHTILILLADNWSMNFEFQLWHISWNVYSWKSNSYINLTCNFLSLLAVLWTGPEWRPSLWQMSCTVLAPHRSNKPQWCFHMAAF